MLAALRQRELYAQNPIQRALPALSDASGVSHASFVVAVTAMGALK